MKLTSRVLVEPNPSLYKTINVMRSLIAMEGQSAWAPKKERWFTREMGSAYSCSSLGTRTATPEGLARAERRRKEVAFVLIASTTRRRRSPRPSR